MYKLNYLILGYNRELQIYLILKVIKMKRDHFLCDQCEFKSRQKSHLIRHKESKHEGIKYHCNQCDLKFTQKDGLNRHVKTIHEGVRYQCNRCEY